jgi:hypothetical protein
MTAARAIALGTLVVGVLDAADALIFFGLLSLADPRRHADRGLPPPQAASRG